MAEIFNIGGLPKELFDFDKINNEQTRIYIIERRVKGSKFMTQISGIQNPKDAENLFNDLKKELACGGTVRDNVIELQGKHRKKLLVIMKKRGYLDEQIS